MKSTSHDRLKRKSDRLDSWSIIAETANWNGATRTTAIQTSAASTIVRAETHRERSSQVDDQETHHEPEARGGGIFP
jgi:hypothetical protein